MLLVVPVILVMAVSVLFGATERLPVVPVRESHSSLGVVHGLKVVAGVAADYVALRHHLQVGSDAVVTCALDVAEVNDAALVRALVRRLDSGEAEFVGDVASYNLHNLMKVDGQKNKQTNKKTYIMWLDCNKYIQYNFQSEEILPMSGRFKIMATQQ